MESWTRQYLGLVAIGGLLLVAVPTAASEHLIDQGHVAAGRAWYKKYCTPCHAPGGGAGSAVHGGSQVPVDLRRYVARHGGRFPAHEWYAVVEHVDLTSPHAEVWERIRNDQSAIIADGAAARGVVTLIADYVLSVQTK